MKKWLFRCLISLALAGPMMLLSVALANADQVGLRTERVSCLACHPEFQSVWEMGQHARTGSNASFIEAWEAQGKPGDCMTCHATGYDEAEETWVADGVVCAACHPGSSDKHIDDAANNPMPIDRSAKFCGQCHSDTYFDWQASGHYGNGLDCVNCHDPHGTELKTGDPSTLCDNCHVQMASSFSHSDHSAVGVTCADCHLGQLGGDAVEAHARRDHSFNVRLDTCNSCHVNQMHASVDAPPNPIGPDLMDSMSAVEASIVDVEPGPVSPVGFAVLAGLVGMAGGMVLAPWLERWFRRMQRNDE